METTWIYRVSMAAIYESYKAPGTAWKFSSSAPAYVDGLGCWR